MVVPSTALSLPAIDDTSKSTLGQPRNRPRLPTLRLGNLFTRLGTRPPERSLVCPWAVVLLVELSLSGLGGWLLSLRDAVLLRSVV